MMAVLHNPSPPRVQIERITSLPKFIVLNNPKMLLYGNPSVKSPSTIDFQFHYPKQQVPGTATTATATVPAKPNVSTKKNSVICSPET
jgi:hypothetical protein